MLAVIDYNVGNLGSIENMLRRLGHTPTVTNDPMVLKRATKIILPGVGAFDTGVTNLSQMGIAESLREVVLEKKVPILGICVGMQVFAQGSDEGVLPGFGWFPTRLVRFHSSDPSLKVPHMGWNGLVVTTGAGPLFDGLDQPRFYFAHSFHLATPDDESTIAAWSEYGYRFPAALRVGNIYGVQFHPEKSHRFGMRLLKNFVELCN